MRRVLILLYMLMFHPVLFWRYTVRANSAYFLVNGKSRKIKTKNLIIGKNVRIGDDTRINFYANGKLTIGNGCYIGQRNSFLVGENITIKDNVLMASDICIASENHGMNPMDSRGYSGQPLITKPVSIAEGCWIGEKVIILPGVEIGEKSIIGAGSVVTRNIPSYSVAIGNPARVIKTYDRISAEWIKFED